MLPLLRAPQVDGGYFIYPPFQDIPRILQHNLSIVQQKQVTIDGLSLLDLQQLLRREIASKTEPPLAVSQIADSLIAVSGHQPELDHPGVWLKHFFLQGFARKFGAVPLHLIADHDLPKRNYLSVPWIPRSEEESATRVLIPYDRADLMTPYELRPLYDVSLFTAVPQRLRELSEGWNFEPLALRVWPQSVQGGTQLVGLLTHLRRHLERLWGCQNYELPVSKLAQTEAFRRFARHLIADLSRFRKVYNSALQRFRDEKAVQQPVRSIPELEADEVPFWEVRGKQRLRATRHSPLEKLRPRALTLTLFCRLVLGHCFIHGLGGALYDQITDALIADYFGLAPPHYLVVTGTLYLPLSPDVQAYCCGKQRTNGENPNPAVFWHLWRDVYWNPQRHLPAGAPAEARQLAERKLEYIRQEPPLKEHAARRRWFQTLRTLTETLRGYVSESLQELQEQYRMSQRCHRCQQVFRRRDYSWVLFPEEVLRPFLTQFLDGKPIIT
ncbi:hypothetical protein [Thermogemmata fonticola]|uniref:Uncharacterized protein n=1 Tax=Thermogemmata fonticola TaxID=2755323 RepID=A0A7V8VB57_9BACT|nr:hypothetical protein [Thermogemmata fonticola]MBA2224804.1 hypothetical protein [Thermogemmata fonticola]